MMVCAVIDIFPNPAVGHRPGALQLREMTGDTRLTHAQNFLQLGDGKLFLFEEKQQAQTGWVRQ